MANKPKCLTRANGDVVMIEEIYEAAKRDAAADVERLQQQLNEQKQLADLGSMIKLKDADEAQSRFMRVMFLRRAKETLKKEGRWTSFCRENNIDIKQADYEISKVGDFRDELLLKFGAATGFELNKIRYLTYDDSKKLGVTVKNDKLFFNGEEIPFVPEEVQAVLEKVKSDYRQQLEEVQSEALASKRVIKLNMDQINKQAKEIDYLEGRAKEKGLTPDEESFLKYLDLQFKGFDVYMWKIDPMKIEALQTYVMRDGEGRTVPTNVTKCMRAAYIEKLAYMHRLIRAAHETAKEMFGSDIELPEEVLTLGALRRETTY